MCHRRDEFHQCIENNSTLRSAVITTEEIFEIIRAECQSYYRIQNKYIVKELLNTKCLYVYTS